MPKFRAGDKEKRFAEIVWSLAPVKTSTLVEESAKEFGWARSTMYTVLRRLIDKGLFESNNGVVTVLLTKDQFEAGQSREFVDVNFDGSLAHFLRAYYNDKADVTDEQVADLEKSILHPKKKAARK